MKFVAVCLSILGLIPTLAFCEPELPHPGSAGPRAVPDVTEVDFGLVTQGDLTSRTVQIRNDGDAPLFFKRIIPSVTPSDFGYSLPDQEVLPGDTAVLLILLDSCAFQRRLDELVEIETNERKDFTPVPIRVRVTADVKPRLRLHPPLFLLRSGPGPILEETMVIENAARLGYTAASVKGGLPGVGLRVTPFGKNLHATWTLDPDTIGRDEARTGFVVPVELRGASVEPVEMSARFLGIGMKPER